jgi:hypothetical protein
MLPLRRRDLDHRDLVHHLVHDLVLLQLMEHLDGMDRYSMVRQNLYVADIAKLNLVHLLDVVKMDEQQNLDELNLDEVRTFLDVAHHFLANLADVQVDAELRHLLRTDYFLDVVDAEQRHLLRTDYFLDVEQAYLLLQNFLLPEVHLAQSVQLELALQHVGP